MKKGDVAAVVRSRSSDVVPGTLGVVEKPMKGGYALLVTGYFSDATGSRQVETRCMFFSHKELRKGLSRGARRAV
jgi:hypothetical protein